MSARRRILRPGELAQSDRDAGSEAGLGQGTVRVIETFVVPGEGGRRSVDIPTRVVEMYAGSSGGDAVTSQSQVVHDVRSTPDAEARRRRIDGLLQVDEEDIGSQVVISVRSADATSASEEDGKTAPEESARRAGRIREHAKKASRAVARIPKVPFELGDGEAVEAASASRRGARAWLTNERFVVARSSKIEQSYELDVAEPTPTLRRIGLPFGCIQVRVGSDTYLLAPCSFEMEKARPAEVTAPPSEQVPSSATNETPSVASRVEPVTSRAEPPVPPPPPVDEAPPRLPSPVAPPPLAETQSADPSGIPLPWVPPPPLVARPRDREKQGFWRRVWEWLRTH